MTDKKQEHQQDPATGKGKAKKKHFRRIKPGNMYFRWKADQIGGIPDGEDKGLLSTPIELPDDYYEKLLMEYATVFRRPKREEDETIDSLQKHVKELKQTVANLENKLYTYEKRNNDSQSGDVSAAGH
jgi:hypothetical protein